LIEIEYWKYNPLHFQGLSIFSKRKTMKNLFTALMLVILSQSVLANDDFPGRIKYPHVPYIELDDLYKSLNSSIVIDARSNYEYETLRIKGAISIPLSLPSKKFEKKLLELRTANPDKKLVFYCNGHTCMKSYKATLRSIKFVGLNNVYAYDAGIFDWAKKHPDEAELLKQPLIDPEKLISKADFKSHFIEAEKFIKTADSTVAILDIRERIERDGFYIFSGDEESISLNRNDEKKLNTYLNNTKKNNKTLYVYDLVGKQVRWFQYYLEDKNIKKYYFMKGGAEAFFDIPLNKLID